MKKALFWISCSLSVICLVILLLKTGLIGLLIGAALCLFSVLSGICKTCSLIEKEVTKTEDTGMYCVSCGKSIAAEGSHICWDCKRKVSKDE